MRRRLTGCGESSSSQSRVSIARPEPACMSPRHGGGELALARSRVRPAPSPRRIPRGRPVLARCPHAYRHRVPTTAPRIGAPARHPLSAPPSTLSLAVRRTLSHVVTRKPLKVATLRVKHSLSLPLLVLPSTLFTFYGSIDSKNVDIY